MWPSAAAWPHRYQLVKALLQLNLPLRLALGASLGPSSVVNLPRRCACQPRAHIARQPRPHLRKQATRQGSKFVGAQWSREHCVEGAWQSPPGSCCQPSASATTRTQRHQGSVPPLTVYSGAIMTSMRTSSLREDTAVRLVAAAASRSNASGNTQAGHFALQCSPKHALCTHQSTSRDTLRSSNAASASSLPLSGAWAPSPE